MYATFRNATSAQAEFQSIYGLTELKPIVDNTSVCRLHETVKIVNGVRVYGDVNVKVDGSASVKTLGVSRCCQAGVKELVSDRSFVDAMLSSSVPGYAFVRERGLSVARCWETGVVRGLRAYGRGFCYLLLFRPGFWTRVARVLGAFPLVADVLIALRLAGAHGASVLFDSSEGGFLHCRDGGEWRKMSEVVAFLLACVAEDVNVRVGADKELCEVCGFMVVREGHAGRCRVPVRIDPRLSLVGDALHALDVKVALVSALPEGSHYSVVAQEYCSGGAQRKYLLENYPGLLGEGMSEHRSGSVFEEMYFGQFRREYQAWLRRRLGVEVGFDPSLLWVRERDRGGMCPVGELLLVVVIAAVALVFLM